MPQNASHNIRLLILDDDVDEMELMEAAFRDAGFVPPIKTFTDGCALLNYLVTDQGKSAALLILDLNMPKQNGTVILNDIRQHPELTHLSVIVYSTSSSPEDILEAYRLGCNAYVVKPDCFNEMRKIASGIKRLWLSAGSMQKNNAIPAST